jgi:mono/diheme cytochrome c family protein
MVQLRWRGFLLALLLLACAALAAQAGKARSDLALGERVYKEICFACHGLKGDGKGPGWLNTRPRPQVFTNAVYMSRLTDEYMFLVVKYGKLAVLKREIPGKKFESLAMPAFGAVLDDAQIRELIRFERAFSRGGAPSSEMREIFEDACAVCHGKGGRGDGERATAKQPAPKYFVSDGQPAPMNLTDPELMARFDDEFLFSLIKKGRIGSIVEDGFDTMQGYGNVLSDREIWSVIRYIREAFVKPNLEGVYAGGKKK